MLFPQAGLKAPHPAGAPDAERIIGMVPEDIRPYIVSNIPLSATDAFPPCLPSSSGGRHGQNQIYSSKEITPGTESVSGNH